MGFGEAGRHARFRGRQDFSRLGRKGYMKCAKSKTPYLMVVSCNTTGLARLVGGLIENKHL